jgi:hypothetical protein
VVYDDKLQGPIGAIVMENGRLTVLNQHIHTDDSTVFDTGSPGPALTDLLNDDIIQVSGLTNADGSIQATRITLLPPDAERVFHITGPVSDVAGDTFRINDLTIDYSTAQSMGPMSMMNGPQNGEVVEAMGSLDNDGILIATELRMMDNYSAKKGQMQLAGYINSVAGDTLTISAPMGVITVNIVQDTVFTGGSADDLGRGTMVQVQGGMSMGTLTALEISIIN